MNRIGALAIFLAFTQSACIVAGYSSTGGWFLWPGSVVITLIILFLLMRRGR